MGMCLLKMILGLVVVALLLAGALWAAPDTPTAAGGAAEPVYKPLPGQAVGVVILDPRDALAAERRHGPKDAACFSSGGGSYRWFYLPATREPDGETRTFRTDILGQKEVKIDHLLLADRSALKEVHGISDPYTLVEVVVNGGEGSGPEDRFAATDLKVLDGKQGYLRATEVVRRLERQQQDYLRQRQKAIDGKMEEARKKAAEKQTDGARGKLEQSTSTRLYLTWLREPEKLLVEFRTRVMEGEYYTGKGIEVGGPARPRGEVPPGGKKPEVKEARYGTEWGVDLGIVYEVPKSGRDESSRELPMQTFFQALRPPQGQGAVPQPKPRQ